MSTVNPALNVTFNCETDGGELIASASISAAVLSFTSTESTLLLRMSIGGNALVSSAIATDSLQMLGAIGGEPVIENKRTNWVAWSKIGQASFVLDLTNDAGFRQMEWKGYTFAVIPLGNRVIVYGSEGITVMIPANEPTPTYGFKTLRRVGVKSKNAVVGCDTVHYLIDKIGALWEVKEDGLNRLGYEQILFDLQNPILIYDEYQGRLHICTTTRGFTFTNGQLSGGYENMTGMVYINDEQWMTSPTKVNIPLFSLATDIVDFGVRGHKTIEHMQFGANFRGQLEAALDYRFGYKDGFSETRWVSVNREGVAPLRQEGVEFRLKVRAKERGTFAIDYINVAFKTPDQRFRRGPLTANIGQAGFYQGSTQQNDARS